MAAELKRGRTRTRTQPPSVRALERGLAVLEALSRGGEAPLSEIARTTELTCSTTFRLLETLRQRGYVSQDEQTGRYRLGAAAMLFGAAHSANSRLPDAANAAMQQLVDTTNETANLAILSGTDVVYVHQVESRQSVRMFTQLGARAPVHCTGVGKVLLAWQTPEFVSRLLCDAPLEAFTANTIRTPRQLQAELEVVKRQGYATDDEEREIGVRCVTAPVRDARGSVIAALSLSSPTARFPKKLIPQRAREVKHAADEISARLGYLPSQAHSDRRAPAP